MKRIAFITLLLASLTNFAISAQDDPEPTAGPVITINVAEMSGGVSGQNYHFEPEYSYPGLFSDIFAFDYEVTATGEGDVHLYLDGQEVSNPYIISMQYEDAQNHCFHSGNHTWAFTATSQIGDGEISETVQYFEFQDLPYYYVEYDEETESLMMSLGSYSFDGSDYAIYYRVKDLPTCDNPESGLATEWLEYDGPFKVWYAPQPLTGNVYVETYVMYNENPSLYRGFTHGGIMDLSDEIIQFGIYKYGDYIEGMYCPYHESAWGLGLSVDYTTVCNKYWDPAAHPASYSGDVVVSNGINTIDDYAFAYCPDMTSIEIPFTVSAIGEHAFEQCTGLEKVNVEDLTYWCTIQFADEWSNPLMYAGHLFYGEEEIKDLVLSCETIMPYAFAGCIGFSSVKCLYNEPPVASIDAFYGLYDQTTLFVPNEGLEEYRAHEEWGRFTHIVPYIGAGPGDIDGDGRVSIGDVTTIISDLLQGGELPAYFDVNGDGKVNIGDVTALIKMLLNGN